ncbi:hypothetical protein VTL71DRAFT_11005, partial [Oculimacula yallundae]
MLMTATVLIYSSSPHVLLVEELFQTPPDPCKVALRRRIQGKVVGTALTVSSEAFWACQCSRDHHRTSQDVVQLVREPYAEPCNTRVPKHAGPTRYYITLA